MIFLGVTVWENRSNKFIPSKLQPKDVSSTTLPSVNETGRCSVWCRYSIAVEFQLLLCIGVVIRSHWFVLVLANMFLSRYLIINRRFAFVTIPFCCSPHCLELSLFDFFGISKAPLNDFQSRHCGIIQLCKFYPLWCFYKGEISYAPNFCSPILLNERGNLEGWA